MLEILATQQIPDVEVDKINCNIKKNHTTNTRISSFLNSEDAGPYKII